jgi:transposase
MFEPDKTLQPSLFAFTHRDLVSKESDVWLFIDIFENLHFSEFNKKYRGQGQLAKEPKLMLRTIFYGLIHGVVSGRKLESACKHDNRFIVLSGEMRPDRRTFDRFLCRHEDIMHSLFVDIVRLAQKMGLVRLGRIAIDGSRVKANTTQHRSMSYEKMQRAVEHIENNLAELRDDLKKSNSNEAPVRDSIPKEIADEQRRLEKIKKAVSEIEAEYEDKSQHRNGDSPKPSSRKSLNDSEALSLAHKSKPSIFGYNVQAAVDEKTQIIIAEDIHNKATDYGALPGILDQVKENCQAEPAQVLVDCGYSSAENVREIESHNATPFVAVGKAKEEISEEFFEQIFPTENASEYECKNAKVLPSRKDAKGRTIFTLASDFCEGCEFTANCKAFGKKNISIMPEEDRLAMAALYSRARENEYSEVYKRRKAIIEPVFGNIKCNKGMRIFVRGRKKVSTWWTIACCAHNLEKILKAALIGAANFFRRYLERLSQHLSKVTWRFVTLNNLT